MSSPTPRRYRWEIVYLTDLDVKTYLLGGAIDSCEANGIIHDPKLELENSCFTFDLVPLSCESVDVVIGENWLLRHKAEMVCHEKVVKMPWKGQEVWNDCRSCKVRVGSNGNLLWEASVLLGRKKGCVMDTLKFTVMPFGLTNAPAVFMELMSPEQDDFSSILCRCEARDLEGMLGKGVGVCLLRHDNGRFYEGLSWLNVMLYRGIGRRSEAKNEFELDLRQSDLGGLRRWVGSLSLSFADTSDTVGIVVVILKLVRELVFVELPTARVGSRVVDVRTYLLGGAIDSSEANGIIRDPKLELESSRFTFDLVPLSYESVDVVVGENWLLRHKAEMELQGEGWFEWVHGDDVAKTVFRMRNGHVEVYGYAFWVNQCTSGFHGVNEPGGVRVAREDDRGVSEGREDVREVFQQRGSGAKRKLSRCGRNQMGNEPILALPKGADDFIVYYDARSKDLEACLEKGEGDCFEFDFEAKYHLGKANVDVVPWSEAKNEFEIDIESGSYWLDKVRTSIWRDVRTLAIEEAYTTKYSIHPGADTMLCGFRLTNRWLSMKKDIASCGSKYLAYSEVEVEYQGSSGLLLQPELWVVEGLTLERCSTFGKKDKLEPSYVGTFEIFGYIGPTFLFDELRVLMPRVVKSRDEIFSRWGYCDNHDLSRLDNQSIERDRLIGIGFVLNFVKFISFTFGDKEMISVIEAVSFVRILRLREVARVTARIALEFAPEFVYVYRLDFVECYLILLVMHFSVSLLLTPLCCDDIHDVTPRVSALAGCDRLVSEPMVIEN
ncbi:putative reverse transcriptase domain-containing protein [Tanacetum coccineum]